MAETTSAETRRRNRLENAFVEEELRAEKALAPVLVGALAVIAAWVTWENGFPASLFYYPFILAFALIGAGPVLLGRRGRLPRWERYLRFGLGVALYTAFALMPKPFDTGVLRGAIALRWQNELYLFVFLAASAFTYSPRVVLWTGVAAALSWWLGALWISQLPGVTTSLSDVDFTGMSVAEIQRKVMEPNRIFVNGVVRVGIVLVVVAATLAAFVRRSRQMVMRQAELERERGNLSRYFSPNMVDELAQSDLPLSTTRRQDVAVLFIDIVGFTSLSERQSPEEVITTLRQFHQRVERAVFAHDGTLDKYIGDGAMATFGTPRPGETDATNALLATGSLLASLAAWNDGRRARREEAIRAGIGVHYGPVVLGDIGGEQHLEFAALGDTVNVASRLERLTRSLDVDVVVSDALVEAARREGAAAEELLPGLSRAPQQSVRGRDAPVRLWVLRALVPRRAR